MLEHLTLPYLLKLREMLDEYWINMGLVGVRGLPRKLESLESAAYSISQAETEKCGRG